jgi:hypothetical protein
MPDDIDEIREDEEVLLDEETELEDAEPSPEDLAQATVPPEPGAADVESIQELLVKQEAREEEESAEEEETVLARTSRDEPAESIDARVVPMQATEFMCKKCFLVKHRSQLADKKRMLCRDCA